MIDYTSYCTDCARFTNSVFDHTTGDSICSDCGLVLESHFIDDCREWRAFPTPTPPLLITILTELVKPTAPSLLPLSPLSPPTPSPLLLLMGSTPTPKPTLSLHVNPTVHRMMNREMGQFNKALATISHMSHKHLAQHLYSTFHLQASSSFRGKHHNAFLGACLYVACTQEGLPRTVKEISSVANGASKKDILRAKAFVTKHLLPHSDPQRDEDNNTVAAAHEKVVRAGDLVKRFCSNVGMMNHRVMKAAQEAVDKLEGETDVRRSPVSVDGYISSSLEDCSVLVCSATSDQ